MMTTATNSVGASVLPFRVISLSSWTAGLLSVLSCQPWDDDDDNDNDDQGDHGDHGDDDDGDVVTI